MIAEFRPNKRHVDALEALARMRTANAHLAFAGTGPCMEAMRIRARRLGIDRRTHFLGFQADVRPWIAVSRATLLPSLREGLPRSTLESMAMGVPAIGSRVRGLEELLENGRGILVPARDPAALAEAMDHLAAHPSQAREMGAQARAEIHRVYSLNQVIRRHEELYAEALDAPV
jgi:glycosyltransferase involved in cell wall biosynthesis